MDFWNILKIMFLIIISPIALICLLASIVIFIYIIVFIKENL